MKGRIAAVPIVAFSLSVVLASWVFVCLSIGTLPKYPEWRATGAARA